MKIKKSALSVKRLSHMPPSLAQFIEKLESCSIEDLPRHIREFGILWDLPRGDLHYWISVLNRFDTILEEATIKSGLNSNLPTAYVFNDVDEELLVAVLDFTALLLEHCSRRSLYASSTFLSQLLYTTSLPILISTLKVCARLAQRYAQVTTNRSSMFLISQEKMFRIANSFPMASNLETLEKVKLYDFVNPDKKWSKEWSSVALQYYQNPPESKVHRETESWPHPSTPTPVVVNDNKAESSVDEAADGLSNFSLSSQFVESSSLTELLDKVFTVYAGIPKDFLIEAFLKTRAAKAFANGEEGLLRRKQQVVAKCLAIEFLTYFASENALQVKLFASNPNLVLGLCDLIHPDNKIDVNLRTNALEALQALAHYRPKHHEILSALSANVNHGLLLYVIRQMVKDLENDVPIDEYYADRWFSLVQILGSSVHSAQVLVTAGIVPVLKQMLTVSSTHYNLLSMVIEFLQHIVLATQHAFTEFVQIGGLDLVVERIAEEVNYDIENPEEVEQSDIVDYKIPYIRFLFLKALFKLLLSMMQSPGNADRLRNLIESSILQSLKKIISNSQIFGTNIVNHAIDMMSMFIHNEPTSYAIINECKLPQVFLESIPQLIKLSKTTTIPYAIGAICLNNSGLELVQKTQAIKEYMKIFTMTFHARIMTVTNMPSTLGNAFDEMVRHHPRLKDEIFTEIVETGKSIYSVGENFKGGARFFPVRSEVLKTDEDDDEIVSHSTYSDITSLVDCYARFLEAFLQNSLHCKDFIKRNGFQNLVNFYRLPSLPYDFPSRTTAMALTKVFKLAAEVDTFFIVMTLLSGTAEAIKPIRPFLEANGDESYFIQLEKEDAEASSQFMKSFNSVHCLVFVLSHLYSHLVYPHSKSTLPMILPFSNSKAYAGLLDDIGQLQRNCIWEEIFVTKDLSREWRDATKVLNVEDLRSRNVDDERKAQIAEAEAKVDVTDSRYKNVKTIRYMTSQIPGSLSKILSGLSKWTLSRRIPDAWQKKYGFKVADNLAQILVQSLSYKRIELYPDVEDKFAYWLVLLSGTHGMLFDEQRVGSRSLQTVFTICFKRKGGIQLLLHVIESLWGEIKEESEMTEKARAAKDAMAYGEMVVLQILATLVNSRAVNESPQSIALNLKERDLYRSDYFNSSQFLIELKSSILPVAQHMWASDAVKYASDAILKGLISILIPSLSPDGENGALSKNDVTWTSSQLDENGFRVNTNDIARVLADFSFSRLEVDSVINRDPSQQAEDAIIDLIMNNWFSSRISQPNTASSATTNENLDQDAHATVSETDDATIEEDQDENDEEEREGEINEEERNESAQQSSLVEIKPNSASQSLKPVVNYHADNVVKFAQDLNELRQQIKASLVERALYVLRLKPSSVFDVSELIATAFCGKSMPSEPRHASVVEIFKYLEDLDLSVKENSKQIKSTAHLLGLLIQNDSYLNSAMPELSSKWDLYLKLLEIGSSQRDDDDENYSWIPNVLLVVEKILSIAEQPVNVVFDSEATEHEPILKLDQVSLETRIKLFERLNELPVLKSDAIATAAARVLVILTRKHELAVRAFKEGILSKLLSAAYKFVGATQKEMRLQNAITIILRHVLDDPDTLATTMEKEIVRWFSQPRFRSVDVTSYVRGNAHVALRNPEIFVNVTNKICKLILTSDVHSRQQSIGLKAKEEGANKKEHLQSTKEITGEGKNADEEDKEMTDVSKGVVTETPLPQKVLSLERTTGVMHFLLNELNSIKDTEAELAGVKDDKGDKNLEEQLGEAAKSDHNKIEFIASRHPKFMSRSFLMEVITELLLSYGQCKLEFISFSRRVPSTLTPSKPRHSVLNYFLNELLPSGSLFAAEDLEQKFGFWTSNMTIRLLNSLVATSLDRLNPEDEEDVVLVHIRKFVLDATLRAFKDVSTSTEAVGTKYSRLLNLGALCYKFLNGRAAVSPQGSSKTNNAQAEEDAKAMAKIMFEKNFVGTLTSALNDIDLNFLGSQKVVRVLLKSLTKLSRVSVELSDVLNLSKPADTEEDYFSTASSPSSVVSATGPNVANSALGMFEVGDGMNYDGSDASEMDEDGEEIEYEEVDEEDEGHGTDDEDVSGDEVIEYVDDEMDYDDGDSEDYSEDDDVEDDGGMDVEIVVTGRVNPEDIEEEVADDDDDDDGDDDGSHLDDIDDESIQDYGEDEDDWQDELEIEEDQDFDEAYDDMEALDELDQLDQLERELADEGDISPEQDGELDEEEEDEEDDEDEDIDESEDMEDEGIPLADLDWDGDLVGPEGDDLQYDWEVEEFLSYDDVPSRRRHAHNFFSNTQPTSSYLNLFGYNDVNPSNPLLVRPPSPEILPPDADPDPAHPDSAFARYIRPGDRIAGAANAGGPDIHIIHELFHRIIRNHQAHRPIVNGNLMTHDIDRMFGRRVSQRHYWEEPLSGLANILPKSTSVRWQEEARMIFASSAKETYITNHILNRMLPIAAEEDKVRREREAETKRALEEKLRKEEEAQLEQERKEKEEAEAKRKEEEEAETASRAAAAAAAEEQAGSIASSSAAAFATEGSMEGVETNVQAEQSEASASSSAEQPRVIVNVGGRDVDVTELGIDPEFLDALPEDMREEVLAAHIREIQTSRSEQSGVPQVSEIEAEFLAALPDNIRQEVLQQEAAERRRLQREREHRESRSNAPQAGADIDFEGFLASLDPNLRQTILAEQDEESLSNLPPGIVDEAHELQRRHHVGEFIEVDGLHANPRLQPFQRLRAVISDSDTVTPATVSLAKQHQAHAKNGIQIVDRAGIASLLRLLYFPQSGTNNQRNPLFDILVSVTVNRQSRTELFNMLMSILQDGTTDVHAVQRSFNQVSARARYSSQANAAAVATGGLQATPLKSSALTPKQQLPVTPVKTPMAASGGANQAFFTSHVDISPSQLAQQCLQALDYIIKLGSQLASYFLIEHENPIGLKRTLSRKGKALKESASSTNVNAKAQKYPINTLLALLERSIITDSSAAMDMLSLLLQEITRPLPVLIKKSKEEEKIQTEKEKVGTTFTIEGASSAAEAEAEAAATSSSSALEGSITKPTISAKKFTPPFIPEHNLCLLVNILTARECPNRTLQQTLAVMQNLSAVPSAKDVFGMELIRQAQKSGKLLPSALQELTNQIKSAKNGSEVQGMALSRFSSASSDQAKLLRVLTAVDYLFDGKHGKSLTTTTPEEKDGSDSKDAVLLLYSKLEFGSLWKALGECLKEIQERQDMLHVATVLLPLIESFMVVCKHEVKEPETKQAPSTQQTSKLVRIDTTSSNSDSSSLSVHGLFLAFTDDHRKILNQMVRNNPKLMSGSFSILVRNPKVLDFDNKRNYFNRQLHTRSQQVHRAMPLNVRRDQVFLDSYKALYFKTGDEIKYSKLNIRFHGEEGVDAGGVTREWFQVLSRQMFNPDYALFIPVASDRTTFHPNRTSGVNPEHLLFFKFIGRIIGKALYEGRVLDCHFSRAVYKRILGKQVSLKDMETLDLEYYKSLVWMLENDITDVITETMSIETDDYGDKKIIDLIPNGRDIPVTEENKHDYVRLVVEYRLLTSVEEQLESFLTGFHDIVSKDLIAIFNEQELELLISGLPEIDVDDWRNNAVYQNYSASSPQIQWFWRAVRSFDAEERAKLLQFVTGTSKVPLNGFAELEGMNGVSRFSIHRDYGHKERLPSSHTCFNQLDMPEYDSYDALRTALMTAITEGREGFGFA
ncbi:hypothetical protein V1514DRAFT_320803 [Lipomyces japonicus]|uniref:uncharacterized protein n=1 Tax=Lipomyces japonicus TaxID=56871 RepID=UPI0034CD98F9